MLWGCFSASVSVSDSRSGTLTHFKITLTCIVYNGLSCFILELEHRSYTLAGCFVTLPYSKKITGLIPVVTDAWLGQVVIRHLIWPYCRHTSESTSKINLWCTGGVLSSMSLVFLYCAPWVCCFSDIEAFYVCDMFKMFKLISGFRLQMPLCLCILWIFFQTPVFKQLPFWPVAILFFFFVRPLLKVVITSVFYRVFRLFCRKWFHLLTISRFLHKLS